MEIKSFKFRTGEEITAEVVERTEDEITIKNPIVIFYQPPQREGEQPVPQMNGWFNMASSEEETTDEHRNRQFTIKKELIFCEANPMSWIKASYDNQFGVGLVVPPTGVTIPGVQ